MQKLVNGVLVDLTQEEVDARNAEVAAYEAEKAANEYKELRKEAYPAIGDQLDALWKGGVDADNMKAVIDGVKASFPKPV